MLLYLTRNKNPLVYKGLKYSMCAYRSMLLIRLNIICLIYRLILHSMLEKIDTYLWAQRPVYASPQVRMMIVS